MVRAILIHHGLNERGGAELVALATIEVLHEMGLKVNLITVQKPEPDKLKNTFGTNLPVDSVRSLLPPHVGYKRSIYHQTLAQLLTIPLSMGFKADLIINTQADIPLPYFTFNGAPLISYVHFPHIIRVRSMGEYPPRYQRSVLWKLYFAPYHVVVSRVLDYLAKYAAIKGIVLTNSEFSKKAIKSLFPKAKPVVVRPPVDTQAFAHIFTSNYREDKILVVGRIAPEKHLENAIELCRLLPQHIKMVIIGTFTASKRSLNYLEKLRKMIRHYKLDGLVELRTNVSLGELVKNMATSKVYFQTMRGEHFGIATVEAMMAGLIPVVPDIGGQTEFIPKRYQYHTIADAVRITEEYLDVPQSERLSINKIAVQFSKEKFKFRMKRVIERMLERS